MSQQAREWLGFVVVVFAGMSYLSLLVWIQARSQGRDRAVTLKTLGLLWGAIAVTVACGWLLHGNLGGPVFQVQSAGGLRLLVRSLSGVQIAMVCGLLAGLTGLYLAAIMVLRRLLGAGPARPTDVPTEPTVRGGQH